jgi:hypothetical protein
VASFTVDAIRGGNNFCIADFVTGRQFVLDFNVSGGRPGFTFVIHWGMYSDAGCTTLLTNADTFVALDGAGNGEAFTVVGVTYVGDVYFSGWLGNEGGSNVFDYVCGFLVAVEDRVEDEITLIPAQTEYILGDTNSFFIQVDGDSPHGGGIAGAWAPSNPKVDCFDPVADASSWHVQAENQNTGFTLNEVGVWYFSYNHSGDECNLPSNTGCTMPVTVFPDTGTGCPPEHCPGNPKIVPTLVDEPSVVGDIGVPINDVAIISGGYRPTGSVTFYLYGPYSSETHDCDDEPVFTDTVTITGNGTYPSASYTPTEAGWYQWVKCYSGDDNNDIVCTDCHDNPVVVKATPALTTHPSKDVQVGEEIWDTATITGGLGLDGDIVFRLYDNDTCSGDPVFEDTVHVDNDGDYDSAHYTTTTIGVFYWTASYGGNDANNPIATECGDEVVTVHDTVTRVTPTVTTEVPNELTSSVSIHDTATISSSASLTGGGALVFKLYGPNDIDCSGTPVATVNTLVTGAGTYISPNITVPSPGVYRWIANYNGNWANNPTTNNCNDSDELVTVISGGYMVQAIMVG